MITFRFSIGIVCSDQTKLRTSTNVLIFQIYVVSLLFKRIYKGDFPFQTTFSLKFSHKRKNNFQILSKSTIKTKDTKELIQEYN
jgi:hypothetical protein